LPAELVVDLDKGAAQLLVTPKLSDLALGFPLSERRGKTLRDGFALGLVGESRVGAMAGIALLMAVAVPISAAPSGSRNRTRAQVAEFAELLKQSGTPMLKGGNSVRHSNLLQPSVSYTLGFLPQKKKPSNRPHLCRAPTPAAPVAF
jgi:hypothetical protein